MKKTVMKTVLAVLLGGAAEAIVSAQASDKGLEQQGSIALVGAATAGAALWVRRPRKDLTGALKVLGAAGTGAATAILAAPVPTPQALLATAVTGAILGVTAISIPSPREGDENGGVLR